MGSALALLSCVSAGCSLDCFLDPVLRVLVFQASAASCGPSAQLQSHPIACWSKALTEANRADEMKDAYPPSFKQGNWGRKHHRWASFSWVSVQSTLADLFKCHGATVATPAFQAVALSVTKENLFSPSPPIF